MMNGASPSRSPSSWTSVHSAKRARRRRLRRRRPAFTSAKSPTSEKAMFQESDALVKSIDAVLGKVHLPCFFSRSRFSVVVAPTGFL